MDVELKIKHIFADDDYRQVYDESADLSRFRKNITQSTRYKWLLNKIKSYPEIRHLLDIGCHKGEFDFALAREGYTVTAVDIAEGNIDFANKLLENYDGDKCRLSFFTCSAEKVDSYFTGRKFDGIIIMELLEHVSDVDTVLKAVDRIVKPGGYVIVTVPYTYLETLYRLIFNKKREAHEHVRRFYPENIPVYFQDKSAIDWEEIAVNEEVKWLGITYKVQ